MKETVLERLREVRIAANNYYSLVQPPSSEESAEPVPAPGGRDEKGFFMAGAALVVNSHREHPIIRDILNGGKSVTDRVRPVLLKAQEVQDAYTARGSHCSYFRPSEILDSNEFVVKELEGMLDFGQYYKRGFVVNPETVGEVISYFAGSDVYSRGLFRNMGIFAGTGALLGYKYLVSSTDPIGVQVLVPVFGGFFGVIGGLVSTLATMPFDSRTPDCVIANKSKKLLDDATFLDETLRDYQSIREGKWINTFVRGPKPSEEKLKGLGN